DVDDFDLLHAGFNRVEPLAVTRERGAARDAGLERNGADDLLRRLVDDPVLLGIRPDDEGSVPRGNPRLLGFLLGSGPLGYSLAPRQTGRVRRDNGGQGDEGSNDGKLSHDDSPAMGRSDRSCASPSERPRTSRSSRARD